MQCAHCATPVPDDAKFCYNCGSQVSDAEGQAAATAAMDRESFAHMEKLLREDTAGEFEIHKMLGRGGMAVVYLATEVHLSRKVALKVLPPELTFGHGIERFKREAKTAAALDHSNIIPIYRISSSGKIFWYAMKFLEGRSLEDVIKEKKRLPLQETIQILWQVADALDYAHEHRVIHRDMKPANVMLDARDRVVVTDFGIAKALTERTLTASGSVVGTPYYMSPEQGMGKPVTGRADQYSLAVMAYRMLSGQVPFEGDSAIDILHKHVMVAPPSLDQACPGLPRHVGRAVHKALEKKPDARFPTVSAFVEALRSPAALSEISGEPAEAATIAMPAGLSPSAKHAAQLPTTKRAAQPEAPAKPLAKSPAKPKKSWKAAVVTLSLAAVAGAGIGGWLLMQQRAGAGLAAGAAGRDSVRSTTAPPAGTVSQPQSVPPTDSAAVGSQTMQPPAGPPQTETRTAPPPTQRPRPAETRPAPVPTTGRLTITGLPERGLVAIDGRRRDGREFDLLPGRHSVRLGGPGLPTEVKNVDVVAGQPHTLAYTAQPTDRGGRAGEGQPSRAAAGGGTPEPAAAGDQLAVVQIRITPWANVSIDGTNRGGQSLVMDTLIAGTHLLRFERDGYVSLDSTITLRPGEHRRLSIRMTQRNP